MSRGASISLTRQTVFVAAQAARRRAREHRVARVSFPSGQVDCTCGEVVTMQAEFRPHEALADAFAVHRREQGVTSASRMYTEDE